MGEARGVIGREECHGCGRGPGQGQGQGGSGDGRMSEGPWAAHVTPIARVSGFSRERARPSSGREHAQRERARQSAATMHSPRPAPAPSRPLAQSTARGTPGAADSSDDEDEGPSLETMRAYGRYVVPPLHV